MKVKRAVTKVEQVDTKVIQPVMKVKRAVTKVKRVVTKMKKPATKVKRGWISERLQGEGMEAAGSDATRTAEIMMTWRTTKRPSRRGEPSQSIGLGRSQSKSGSRVAVRAAIAMKLFQNAAEHHTSGGVTSILRTTMATLLGKDTTNNFVIWLRITIGMSMIKPGS